MIDTRSRLRRATILAIVLALGGTAVSLLAVRVKPPQPQGGVQGLTSRANSVSPSTPWRTLAPGQTLTRIGFGSCLDQRKPQPIWSDILAAGPQLFLMLGDSVYGDVKSQDLSELREAYRLQLAHADFAVVRRQLSFLATWDDHDYGRNDAGGEFEHREASERMFRAFWQMPRDQASGPGLAHARIFGPDGRRVQIIMLDTRSFRSGLVRAAAWGSVPGPYLSDSDPEKTMLGAAQWAWLEAELRRPAELRLLVSSVQVLSDGHAFERWGNLPRERDRLLRLIETTGAKGTIILSGDRHLGAFYTRKLGSGQHVPEITSSALNRPLPSVRDARTAELDGDLFPMENFGLIEIDWQRMRVSASLSTLGQRVLALRELPIQALAPQD